MVRRCATRTPVRLPATLPVLMAAWPSTVSAQYP